MKILEYGLVFGVGAMSYTLIEILWRGYTHWSMTLTGGFCLSMLYLMNVYLSVPFTVKCLLGALTITVVEFVVGCIVNLTFHRAVWDYSALRFNLMGQICLRFSLMWFALCIPAYIICDIIRKYIPFA